EEEEECVYATAANQTLHRMINTMPIDKFVLKAPTFDRHTNYRMVFIVISAPFEKYERDEIRRTWANEKSSITRKVIDSLVIFLMGRSSIAWVEAADHNDILQVDVDDVYRSMVYKVECAFRWVRENLKSEFVVKVDSDTVIHVDRLNEHLKRLDQRGSDRWMTCYRWLPAMPIRDSCHRWFVAEEDFGLEYFPEYCNGPGYVMKRSAFDTIVDRMGSVKVFEVEDAFFTGVVARNLVDLYCVDGMVSPLFTEYSSCDEDASPTLSVLTTHFQFGEEKSKKNLTAAYERLKRPLCDTTVTRWLYQTAQCK
ncbi:hypothetical protein PFISCL1PPCAC_9998, partial [Pristionchus fissidentatus]